MEDEELEGIVQGMIDSGESEEDIASTIKNYKPNKVKEESDPKELETAVQGMIDKGDSEEDIASFIKGYGTKKVEPVEPVDQGDSMEPKPVELKGVQTGGSGESASPSEDMSSSSDSKSAEFSRDDMNFGVEDILDRKARRGEYERLKYSTPEELNAMGVNYVPETYEEYSKTNPTFQQKLSRAFMYGGREKLLEEREEQRKEFAGDLYERTKSYSKQKEQELTYEKFQDKTELTEEDSKDLQDELKRRREEGLSTWETAKAYAVGAATGIFGSPESTIKSMIDQSTYSPEQEKADLIERKRIEYMKELDPEDVADLKEYQTTSVDGPKFKSTTLRDENKEIITQSEFLESMILKNLDKPVYKEFKKISDSEGQEAGQRYVNSLSIEDQEVFIDTHMKLMDSFELHQSNMEKFNSNTEDLQSYDVEVELLKKNFGLGTNLALTYVDSAFNIMGGAMGAALDPVVELTKPEGISYKQHRENLVEGTLLGYMEDTQEEIEGVSLGRKYAGDFLDNPLEYMASLAAEQLPVMAAVMSGSAGLGVIGASSYGGKVKEYSREDGDVSAMDRLAAGLTATGEILSERVTQGILGKGRRVFEASISSGKSSIFTKAFAKSVMTKGKDAALSTNLEGSSEAASGLTENFADIYIVGDKSKTMFDGLGTAYFDGALMGTTMSIIPEIAGATIGKFYGASAELRQIKDLDSKIKSITTEAMKDDISGETFNILEERVNELQKAKAQSTDRYFSKLNSISAEGMNDLNQIAITSLKEKRNLEAIEKDESLDAETKQDLIATYKSRIKKLDNLKEDLLVGVEEKGKTEGKTKSDKAEPPKEPDQDNVVKPTVETKSGGKLFSAPNPETKKIVAQYKKDKSITTPDGEPVTELDTDLSKEIADAYEAMEDNPNAPEVKEAYEAMAKETMDQYQYMIDSGYTLEMYQGEGDPYANSQEMIADLTDNKHLFIFSTEQGFGTEGISDKQRSENVMLGDAGVKDKNGNPMLINDVFRGVHDFFGHSERGNSFGAKGEENAWDVHSRMYGDKARRAMTTETRGQNSWVNFGGQMRNPDGSVMKKGDEGFMSAKERPFAPQKTGLLPEKYSEIRSEVKPKQDATPKKPTRTKSEIGERLGEIDTEMDALYDKGPRKRDVFKKLENQPFMKEIDALTRERDELQSERTNMQNDEFVSLFTEEQEIVDKIASMENSSVKEISGDLLLINKFKGKLSEIRGEVTPKQDAKTKDQGTTKEGTDTSKPTDVGSKQKAQDRANDFREKFKTGSTLKDSLSNLSSGVPKGLLDAAWDTSVEAVALTIEAGGSLSQAIQNGITKLKESDWYKGLSKKGQQDAEKGFKDGLEKEVSSTESKDIKPKPKLASKPSKRGNTTVFENNTTGELNLYKVDDKGKIINLKDRLQSSIGQFFSDKLFDFKKITKNLAGFSKFLEQDSVWQSKASGRTQLAKRELNGIREEASSKGVSEETLNDWLYAKHAGDRNAYIKDNVNEDNPFGSGMDDVEIAKILDVSDKQRELLDGLADKVHQVIEANRQRMLESGLIDQKGYDELSKVDSYVPLTNFFEEELEVASVRQGKSLTIKGNEWKKAGGRTTKAGNILVNILMQTTDLEIRAAKNEFLNSIHDLLLDNPKSSELAKIFSDGQKNKTKSPTIGENIWVGVKVKGVQKWLKFQDNILAQNVQNTTDEVQSGWLLKTASIFNNYFRTVVTTLDPDFMLGNFPRDLATAIIHLEGQKDTNPNLDAKSIATETVKRIPKAIKTIARFERNMKDSDPEMTKLYIQFIKDGAKTGWVEQTPYDDLVREVNALGAKKSKTSPARARRAAMKLMEDANTSVENGVRFSSYVSAINAGASRSSAASLAKELTVNFNRKGNAGTILNAMYLFSNTAIQGSVNIYKNLAKVKKYKDINGKVKTGMTGAQKFALALPMLGAALTLFNRGISEENEETGLLYYDEIDDWIKERNLIIMTTGRNYVTFPLSYGYNVFYNVGQAATDVFTGNKDAGEAASFMTGSVLGSFSPIPISKRDNAMGSVVASLVPTEVGKFTSDILSNKNFAGIPIYRDLFGTEKGEVPTSGRGKDNSPQWMKDFTVGLNKVTGGTEVSKGEVDLNPDILMYALYKGGGGSIKYAERLFTMADKTYFNVFSEPATAVGETIKSRYNVDDKRKTELYQIPAVRKYFGETQDSYYSQVFYEIENAVYTNYNITELKLIKDKKRMDDLSPIERKKVGILMRDKRLLDKANQRLSKIRKREKRFVESNENEKDLQANINANLKFKYEVYMRVYKDYKKSEAEMEKLNKKNK